MTARCLAATALEKPWGRAGLPPQFRPGFDADRTIGELVHANPAEAGALGPAPLLVKHLFTSQRLSVQVHPDDTAAVRAGLACGKDEAWIVTAAEPGATIGVGLIRPVGRDALAQAARDGSIVDLIDWQAVRPGDAFYSPAGTVHAIGAGVSVVEVQQACDVTYRLFDYGRPRELHLAEALAVARTEPCDCRQHSVNLQPGRQLAATGPKLAIERLDGAGTGMIRASPAAPVWLIPIEGESIVDGQAASPGEVWWSDAPIAAALAEGAQMLVTSHQPIDSAYWAVRA